MVAPPSELDPDGDGVTYDVDQCPNTDHTQQVDAVGCSSEQLEIAGRNRHSLVLRTGRTISVAQYDDGYYQWGTARNYVRDDALGIVHDTVNNLYWEDKYYDPDEGLYDRTDDSMPYVDAAAYCTNLVIGDKQDWRLPSFLELVYLLDHSGTEHALLLPAAFWFRAKTADFPLYPTGRYREHYPRLKFWSYEGARALFSKSSRVAEGDTLVHLPIKSSDRDSERVRGFVRCVHRGDGDNDYTYFKGVDFSYRTLDSERVAVDENNHLMWQDSPESGTEEQGGIKPTWEDANQYCASLEWGGFDDWRLANINELFTLLQVNYVELRPLGFEFVDGGYWALGYWGSTSISTGYGHTVLKDILYSNVDDDARYQAGRLAIHNARYGRYSMQLDARADEERSVRCVRDYAFPVAARIADQTISVGDTLVLDASGGYDANGDALGYQWLDTKGSYDRHDDEVLGEQASLDVSAFVPGIYYIRLTVTDTVLSLSDTHEFVLTVIGADSDGDGVADVLDQCPDTAADATVDEDGCAASQRDSDSDGITDDLDQCPDTEADATVDEDGCTIHAPVASGATVQGFKDQLTTIQLQVSDADDDVLTLGLVNLPAHGTVWIDNTGLAHYLPHNGFLGQDSFSFDASDGVLQSNIAVVSINVVANHPLSTCPAIPIEDDYYYKDHYPPENIDWLGEQVNEVAVIERAFNHARLLDDTVSKYLKMPDQSTWDAWSTSEKALFLLNAERTARGIKPFQGVSPEVEAIAQLHAEDLVENNVLSHHRSSDNASPAERLNEDATIAAHADVRYIRNESGFAMSTADPDGIDAGIAVAVAVYVWLYIGQAWGHRDMLLQVGLNEDSGDRQMEGLIGVGLADGTYDIEQTPPNRLGVAVVLNLIDPYASWDSSLVQTVDSGTPHQCNDQIPLHIAPESVPNPDQLIRLVVDPGSVVLPIGRQRPIQVTGIYSDGTTEDLSLLVDYPADGRAIIAVAAGTITALRPGTVSLFAALDGLQSNRVPVHVGPAVNTDHLQGSYGAHYLHYIPDNAIIKAYDPMAFALYTGQVVDSAGAPLAGVQVSIHRVPEYGTTTTDEQGRFILTAEAGQRTLIYRKSGYLTVHRTLSAASHAWTAVEKVMLLTEDPKASRIELGRGGVQTHQSTLISDTLGSRATTLVFDEISTVYIQSADGHQRTLDDFYVRATEYPQPHAMPALLPQHTEFTYCAELQIDGIADDAQVTFAGKILMYVDNFLGFAVGEIVPVGYYDRTAAHWQAAENGVVVKLLDSNNDQRVDGIDYTGDAIADDLDGDGDTTDETAGIEHYPPRI